MALDRRRGLPLCARATDRTSVEQIDRTFGHLLPNAADHERGLLDAFDAREAVSAESFGRGLGAGV